jgi:hypothetical protein
MVQAHRGDFEFHSGDYNMGAARKAQSVTRTVVITERYCWKCKATKPVSEYAYDGTSKDGYRRVCKACNIIQHRTWAAKNHESVKAKRKAKYESEKHLNKERYAKHRVKWMEIRRKYAATARGRMFGLLNSARDRSKKNGWSYDLDFEWLHEKYESQDGRCALTGLQFRLEAASGMGFRYNPLAPSLDRIDTNRGYTRDNVRLVCTAINLALNEFGEEFFAGLCKAYLEHRTAR